MARVAWGLVMLIGCHQPATPTAPSSGPVVLADHRLHAANLAIDADGLYWTERTETETSIVSIAAPIAPRAPIVLARSPGAIGQLVIDRDAFYFAASSDADFEIRRTDKRGGHATTLVPDSGFSARIAIDHTDLYWADGGGKISRIPKLGGAPVTLVDNVEYSYADAIAVDEHDVVFSNALDDTPRRIYRIAKQGGEVTRVDDANGITAWTIIDGAIYYGAGGAVWKVAADAPASTRVRVGTEPFAIIGGAERLFTGDDPALRTLRTLGGDVGPVLYANRALWYVHDSDPQGGAPTAQIGMYALR